MGNKLGELCLQFKTTLIFITETMRISNMKSKLTKGLLIATAIVALLGAALPAAQASAAPIPDQWQKTTKTITITQDQINSSYRVTNPVNRAITDVSVTIGQGQVSVAATVTKRGEPPVATVSIWQPVIRYGLIDWKFVSATANGQPVTPDLKQILIRIHQVALRNLVRAIIRHNAPVRVFVTDVTLTPGLITITANVWENVPATPAPTAAS
jgi:hypothetical protein